MPKSKPLGNWTAGFLESYRRLGNISSACAAAAVSRATVYRQRAARADFAALMDEAREQAVEAMEAEAWRRAVEGVPDFKLGKNGEEIPMRRYSDTLLIFLLKAAKPEKYRERLALSGDPSGFSVVVEHVHATK
jgi:hypothetical protein